MKHRRNICLDLPIRIESDTLKNSECTTSLTDVRIAFLIEGPCFPRRNNDGVIDDQRALSVYRHRFITALGKPSLGLSTEKTCDLEHVPQLERQVNLDHRIVMGKAIAKFPDAFKSNGDVFAQT